MDNLEQNIIARRVVEEILDGVLFTCSNPYKNRQACMVDEGVEQREYRYQFREWNSDENMINVWWLVWGEKIELEVRTECQKLSIEYEVTNDSRPNFTLQYVWWAQPNKSNPFANVSNTRVPPPQELVAKVQSIKILWIGTSISDQSIKTNEIERKTASVIQKEKIFTIIRDGKIKPHLNLQDQARSLINRQEYNFVILECGVNDISNAPVDNPTAALEEKISTLKQLVLSLVKPEMEIIVVKPVMRIDCSHKEKLSQWFGRRLETVFQDTSVRIEDLGVRAKTRWEKEIIFGKRDGIHLAGEKGSWWATHRATLLVQRVIKRMPADIPWWSALSERRQQAEIDKVLIFFWILMTTLPQDRPIW